MNQTITMGHAPAVRARRVITRIDVRKACIRTLSLARRKSVTIAVISAAVCLGAAIAGNDTAMFAGAFAALAAVRPHAAREGGEA